MAKLIGQQFEAVSIPDLRGRETEKGCWEPGIEAKNVWRLQSCERN